MPRMRVRSSAEKRGALGYVFEKNRPFIAGAQDVVRAVILSYLECCYMSIVKL